MITLSRKNRGFTLVELIVSVGLFALVMTLASGAYLLMISINQRTQAVATGINNLSFAIESMVRSIRTGTGYTCSTSSADPCTVTGTQIFSFTDMNNQAVSYTLAGSAPNNSYIQRTVGSGAPSPLTDASLVNITRLTFKVSGAPSYSASGNTNIAQPYVTIVISGTTSAGPKNDPQTFNIETSATMRGTDL